jgi:hypothetical protein
MLQSPSTAECSVSCQPYPPGSCRTMHRTAFEAEGHYTRCPTASRTEASGSPAVIVAKLVVGGDAGLEEMLSLLGGGLRWARVIIHS